MSPDNGDQVDGERPASAEPAKDADVTILVMAGSPRERSYTHTLADSISAGVERLGATVTRWDALGPPLPAADPSFHDNARRNPDPTVQALVQAADAADGFALLSPIYHNSYTAVLKNALDNLGIAQFHYKPVAVASHGNRATHAVDHLRIVARGLLAVGLPTQICTIAEDFRELPDGRYEIESPDIASRVDRIAVELVAFSRSTAALRARARR
jgi:NAD(P)H-dependent FMN reductase